MKPIRIALCLTLLGLLALPASGFALTVGSPYKTGSLMMFPLIDVSDTTGTVTDTLIAISNSFYEEVNVVCQYRSISDEVGGTLFTVGARDTVSLSLGNGEGSMPSPLYVGEKGEIKCWAVDASGSEQISWNYLEGYAEITDNKGKFLGYPSWNFAADKPRGESVGEPGVIKLSGASGEYDAMPKYLRFSVPATVTEANLSVVLGKEDVRQDRQNIYSKAKFTYNKWGTTKTKCIMDQGQAAIPKTLLGSFRVQGIASTVCDTQFGIPRKTTQNSPLLGVLEVRRSPSGSFGIIMPTGAGADGSGYILWDMDSGVYEKSMR